MITNIFSADRPTFSFEVFPPKKESDIYNIYKTLDDLKTLSPDFISVTYGAGGSNSKKTAKIAAYIQNICDIDAIAHLTAVAMTEEALSALLKELKSKGVSNILALRGDRPSDMTDDIYLNRKYTYASDLISVIHTNSNICVAAACYPEIHPESASMEDDLLNLKKKVDTGVNFLITQLFFDNDKFYFFRENARQQGINIPIIAGILPVISASSIATTIKLSGSSIPPKLSSILAKYGDSPEDMKKAGIDYAINQIKDLHTQGIDGIHLYTMNNSETATLIHNNIF